MKGNSAQHSIKYIYLQMYHTGVKNVFIDKLLHLMKE